MRNDELPATSFGLRRSAFPFADAGGEWRIAGPPLFKIARAGAISLHGVPPTGPGLSPSRSSIAIIWLYGFTSASMTIGSRPQLNVEMSHGEAKDGENRRKFAD